MNTVFTWQLESTLLTQLINLASQQQRSLEEILTAAVNHYLEIHSTATKKTFALEEILKIGRDCATLPDLDTRTPEEILGYDKSPIGLWENKYGA